MISRTSEELRLLHYCLIRMSTYGLSVQKSSFAIVACALQVLEFHLHLGMSRRRIYLDHLNWPTVLEIFKTKVVYLLTIPYCNTWVLDSLLKFGPCLDIFLKLYSLSLILNANYVNAQCKLTMLNWEHNFFCFFFIHSCFLSSSFEKENVEKYLSFLLVFEELFGTQQRWSNFEVLY